MSKIEQFYNKYTDDGNIVYTMEQIFSFAEAYHQSRVNSISDEEINENYPIIDSMDLDTRMHVIACRNGAKWFKSKLTEWYK